MNRFAWIAALVAVSTLSAGSALAQRGGHGSRDNDAYRDSYRDDDRRAHDSRHRRGARSYEVARSLEAQLDRFTRSFDRALDCSRVDGTRRERELLRKAKRLERQTDVLKDRLRHGQRQGNRDLVDRIFAQANDLDRFMRRARLDRRAEKDWRAVTRDLDRLARQYRIAYWQRRGDGHGHRGHRSGRG